MDLFTLILSCSLYPDNSITNAMLQVGSQNKPYTITVDGQKKVFPSESEAASYANDEIKQGHSVEIGLLQIPNRWLSQYNVTVEQILSPCKNVVTGTEILSSATTQCQQMQANNPALDLKSCALSIYKSGDSNAGADYAKTIIDYASAHSFDAMVAQDRVKHPKEYSLIPGDIPTTVATPNATKLNPSSDPKHMQAMDSANLSNTTNNETAPQNSLSNNASTTTANTNNSSNSNSNSNMQQTSSQPTTSNASNSSNSSTSNNAQTYNQSAASRTANNSNPTSNLNNSTQPTSTQSSANNTANSNNSYQPTAQQKNSMQQQSSTQQQSSMQQQNSMQSMQPQSSMPQQATAAPANSNTNNPATIATTQQNQMQTNTYAPNASAANPTMPPQSSPTNAAAAANPMSSQQSAASNNPASAQQNTMQPFAQNDNPDAMNIPPQDENPNPSAPSNNSMAQQDNSPTMIPDDVDKDDNLAQDDTLANPPTYKDRNPNYLSSDDPADNLDMSDLDDDGSDNADENG